VLALVVIGLIIFAYMKQSGNKMGGSNVDVAGVPEAMLAEQTPEAASATQQLINDAEETGAQSTQTISVSEAPMDGVSTTEATVKEIKMLVIAPGTSGINVETGKVITETGKAVENSAEVGSQAAPQQSFPIDPVTLPKSAVKLNVNSSSFSPNEFTVNRGQAVNLAVTNVNAGTSAEIFRFEDPSLTAVVLGVAGGDTLSITFNAPDKAGEYVFYSDMFDHRAQGAVGKMIVK
jgi:nitrous oxide reductase